jgi:hypothetical protein
MDTGEFLMFCDLLFVVVNDILCFPFFIFYPLTVKMIIKHKVSLFP